MHVVVTGGAGFIGSNVTAAYLRDGHRVTVLDALVRWGTERNLRWLQEDVASEAGAGSLAFVRGDVRDAALLRDVIGARDVSLVCHFAAQPAVTTSLEAPRDDLEVNLLGTFNVLEAARTGTAPRPPAVLFTSTNKVYGSLERRAVLERDTRYRFMNEALDARGVSEDEPLDFHSPYGCSKGAADQYVRDYCRIYGLPTIVFRMSCIYGTRQFGNEDQGWLAHFLIAAATGAPLTIFGNGKQVRDMLFVDDLVHAIRRAVEHLQTTAGHVYNIGGGPANTVSIWRELGPRIEAVSSRRLEPMRGGWRPGDQPIYVSDTGAATRDFGWAPRVDLDQGLERLWAWVHSQRTVFEGRRNGAADASPLARAVNGATHAPAGETHPSTNGTRARIPVPASRVA